VISPHAVPALNSEELGRGRGSRNRKAALVEECLALFGRKSHVMRPFALEIVAGDFAGDLVDVPTDWLSLLSPGRKN
jgi:hypothetical protein